MRACRSTGLITAAAVAAGLTVLAPQAAPAANAAPDCTQGGSTGAHDIYYWFCSYSVAGSPTLTWAGAPIVSGQGTGRVKGTCIGGSNPYFITVSWVDSTGAAQTSAPYTLDCAGGSL
jgi:hypothetical protein